MLKPLTAAVALAGLFCSSTPAAAQSLKLPVIVFAGAVSADWTTTHYFLSNADRAKPGQYDQETNRTLSWLNNRPTATVLVGVAQDVAVVWAVNRFVARRHPKIAAVSLYAMSAFRVHLAIDNFQHRPR